MDFILLNYQTVLILCWVSIKTKTKKNTPGSYASEVVNGPQYSPHVTERDKRKTNEPFQGITLMESPYWNIYTLTHWKNRQNIWRLKLKKQIVVYRWNMVVLFFKKNIAVENNKSTLWCLSDRDRSSLTWGCHVNCRPWRINRGRSLSAETILGMYCPDHSIPWRLKHLEWRWI